jgi:hypothetical protein
VVAGDGMESDFRPCETSYSDMVYAIAGNAGSWKPLTCPPVDDSEVLFEGGSSCPPGSKPSSSLWAGGDVDSLDDKKPDGIPEEDNPKASGRQGGDRGLERDTPTSGSGNEDALVSGRAAYQHPRPRAPYGNFMERYRKKKDGEGHEVKGQKGGDDQK